MKWTAGGARPLMRPNASWAILTLYFGQQFAVLSHPSSPLQPLLFHLSLSTSLPSPLCFGFHLSSYHDTLKKKSCFFPLLGQYCPVYRFPFCHPSSICSLCIYIFCASYITINMHTPAGWLLSIITIQRTMQLNLTCTSASNWYQLQSNCMTAAYKSLNPEMAWIHE